MSDELYVLRIGTAETPVEKRYYTEVEAKDATNATIGGLIGQYVNIDTGGMEQANRERLDPVKTFLANTQRVMYYIRAGKAVQPDERAEPYFTPDSKKVGSQNVDYKLLDLQLVRGGDKGGIENLL